MRFSFIFIFHFVLSAAFQDSHFQSIPPRHVKVAFLSLLHVCILFSGLDSKTSLELVAMLSELASLCGICVIMVVHQPRVEIWRAIDRLILLYKGETAFMGSVDDAETHFAEVHHVVATSQQENPADLIIDALEDIGEAACGAWRDRHAAQSAEPSQPSCGLDVDLNEAAGASDVVAADIVADDADLPRGESGASTEQTQPDLSAMVLSMGAQKMKRYFTHVSAQKFSRSAWGASFAYQVWLVFVRCCLLVRFFVCNRKWHTALDQLSLQPNGINHKLIPAPFFPFTTDVAELEKAFAASLHGRIRRRHCRRCVSNGKWRVHGSASGRSGYHVVVTRLCARGHIVARLVCGHCMFLQSCSE